MSDTPDRKPPTDRPTCGTLSGPAAHRRNGERTCEKCLIAGREYQRARRAKIKRGEPTHDETKAEKREKAEVAGDAVLSVVSPTPADRTTPGYPNFLKAAGRKLWDEVTAEYDLSPASLAVLTSACRMTDQLERFTAALSSRSVLWFELGDLDEADVEKGVPVVVVNGMIGEGRQLANAIRTALSQIGVLKTGSNSSKGGALDELKKRRAARQAAQA